MKVVINQGYEASDKATGQVVFKLGAGFTIDSISDSYIPNDSKILRLSGGDSITKGEIDVGDYYFFYLMGTFFAVLKNVCSVPKSVGWKANF